MRKAEMIQVLYQIEDYIVSGAILAAPRENPHLKNCWQVLKCERKRCPSYGLDGNRCWHHAGTFCPPFQPYRSFARKWPDCRDCEVFHASTPTRESRETELANNIFFSLSQRGIHQDWDHRLSEARLTPRELQVYELILQRLTREEMARQLKIKAETVKMHTSNLMKKLKVRRRIDLCPPVAR
jgi:DNA-binding CsgD family transcriptional regulator